jgi:hypothetical protein
MAYWKTLVGDEAAATCIEPSEFFFKFLEANSLPFGNSVTLINKLVGEKSQRLVFTEGSGTGGTRSAGADDESIVPQEKIISLEEVLKSCLGESIVFKTDTDGFDGILLSILCALLVVDGRLLSSLDVIFTEGPSLQQMYDCEYSEFLSAFERLLGLGFNVAVFSNNGNLLVDEISNSSQLRSVLLGLEMSFLNGKPLAHFYDFVFYKNSLRAEGWAWHINSAIRGASLDKSVTYPAPSTTNTNSQPRNHNSPL